MAELIYLLCACTSVLCSFLLIRQYRGTRLPLLLWSSFGFIGLALNNALLFIDLIVVPTIDLSIARTLAAFVGISLMVFGLIWEQA
jgi:hypothetical protein